VVNTNNNEDAIIHGQANTGRVITAAALIMVCVFFSFAVGGERIIAEFVLVWWCGVDGRLHLAYGARTSLMHFFGKANWWMPKWLDRIVPHVASKRATRSRPSETAPGVNSCYEILNPAPELRAG